MAALQYAGCIAAVCATVVLGAGSSFAAPDRGEDDSRQEGMRALVEVGKYYYDTHCVACHGLSAQGGGPTARSLKVAPPDLTRIAARRDGKFDVDELSRLIDGRLLPGAHGSREMPIWGSVFAAESVGGTIGDEIAKGRIVALLEYLRTLQRQ